MSEKKTSQNESSEFKSVPYNKPHKLVKNYFQVKFESADLP